MKRVISVLTAVLCVITASLAILGCGDKGGDPSAPANRVMLSSFSEFKELRSFKYGSTFGKAEITTDKNYVTDGDTAAKFTIDGKTDGVSEFSVFCDTKWNTKKDFTNVKALGVDVFNPQSEPKTVKISFMTRLSGNNRAQYVEKAFTLNSGKNTVVYEIDREVAAQICYLDSTEYIKFAFDRKADKPYVIYMDRLEAHLTDEKLPAVEKNYRDGELLFFDDKADRYFVKPNTIRAQAPEAPEISLCRDPRFVRSGSGSLQVKAAVYPSGTAYDSPGITISGNAVSRVDFSQYTSVEFYVMSDRDLTHNENVAIEFYDVNDVLLNSIDHLRNYVPWGKTIPANTWYKLEVKVDDLDAAGLDVTKIDRINVYCSYSRFEDFEFSLYFDDFTLVK